MIVPSWVSTIWVRRLPASQVEVTVASGASPSGPIHLGNLREFLTVHFVAEEIRRRGVNVRHLHSWDDYDRFRKVPAGVDPAWSEHIGRPLSAVPDPTGEFASWAERFKAPLRSALADLGCDMVEVNQTEMYRAGTYREQVLTAIRRRGEIETVMARFRTKKAADPVEVPGAVLALDVHHGRRQAWRVAGEPHREVAVRRTRLAGGGDAEAGGVHVAVGGIGGGGHREKRPPHAKGRSSECCGSVNHAAPASVTVFDEEALDEMRRTLSDLASRCHGDERPDCPILDRLEARGR